MIFRVAWDGRDSWLYGRRSTGHWTALRPVGEVEELDAMMAHEVDPEDYTLLDTQVEQIGRGFFLVKSQSRPDIVHVVDTENNVFGPPPACSCEQNRFRKEKCKHLRAVLAHVQNAEILKR